MKTDEEQPTYDIDAIRKQNSALRKYALFQKASEEKIGCQKIYVDIAGGIPEAFILDELIFFTLPRQETGKSGLRIWKNGVLWMAVSRTEWWNRKRLTPKEADGAIIRLLAKKLIFKDQFMFNKQKTTHLRLNVPEFFRLYMEILEKENPPENDSESVMKDLEDLYEMMGIPKRDTPEGIPNGDTGILKRDKVSLNGDSFNSPDTTLTQPYGADAPDTSDLPIDWQLGLGVEVNPLSEEEFFKKQARDSANMIEQGCAGAGELAYAFMVTRKLIIPEGKAKGQRKAAREMLEMKVEAQHVVEATKQLMNSKDRTGKPLTVVDLFSISNTAINIANLAPTKKEEGRQFPTFENGKVVMQ